MFIVTNRKWFFLLASVLTALSIGAVIIFGVRFGTDFTGGSLLEVSFTNERPSIEVVRDQLDKLNLGEMNVRPSGEKGYVIRARELSPGEKTTIELMLSGGNRDSIKEERFNSVGPVFGESLKRKSYYAITAVILCIVLFITFAFRKVSEPVASWKFGIAAIVSLAHDVVLPVGAYVTYGYFTGAEIDLLFITALLAILGYSVHDTIVVFDRVREHLRLNQENKVNEPFEKTVGESLRQTMGRSINTSVTIFLVLLALYVLGSQATEHFAFTLLFGVIAGTYSSIFLASPLLVTLEKIQSKK